MDLNEFVLNQQTDASVNWMVINEQTNSHDW